jgi:predicted anti-sigma-YlaC factor YlaD
MDCRRFEEILDRLAAGRATPVERADAEAHLRSCEACGLWQPAAVSDSNALPPEADEALTRSILEITSGPACARAEQVLANTIDEVLESGAARILQMHLSGCARCAELARTMRSLKETLPEMAEIDPGPAFAGEVIRAARASLRIRVRRWAHPARIWYRLIRRPLFTWEAAYAGTVLFAILFLNPWFPLREYASQAVSAAEISAPAGLSRVVPAGTLPEAAEIARTASAVSARVTGAGSAIGRSASDWTKSAKTTVDRKIVPSVENFLGEIRKAFEKLFAPPQSD